MASLFKAESRKVMTTGMLISAILILVYVGSQWVYTSFDATEERRYTLAPATKTLLKNLDDRIYIKVLLDGRFPAGFKRLQESTEDMLRRFAIVSPEIEYNFENPNEGTIEEVNERRQALAEEGLVPTKLRISDAAGASSQYIFPYAIINHGNRSIPVSLLQDDIPGADKEEILNNSIGLLEYKIADGIQKIMRQTRKVVAFSEGQG
ncbi:MAG TPA: Gldg family protein, partial [Saprospiraceae bacterium]